MAYYINHPLYTPPGEPKHEREAGEEILVVSAGQGPLMAFKADGY